MIRIGAIYFVRFWAKIFYRHKNFGKENITDEGGIVAPNHTSYLDPPFLGSNFPGRVHFLAKSSLFSSKFSNWFLQKLGAHPIKRGEENIQAFKLAISLLKQGKKVVLFPEGTRSRDGELQKGQLGVSMLVLRSNCKVFPVYIHGTFPIWKKGKRFPKLFGKTACVFGKPLDFSDVDRTDKKLAQQQITERIMDAIRDLRDWYLANCC